MSESILLESPVFNLEAAIKAYQYGVKRLELCSAFSEGGLTPGRDFSHTSNQILKYPFL